MKGFNTKTASLLAVSVLVFAACSTSSVYREANAIDQTGFTSGITEDGRHYVTMTGDARTPEEKVYFLALEKAIGIARENRAVGIEVLGVLRDKQRDDARMYMQRNGFGAFAGDRPGSTLNRRGPIRQRAAVMAIEFRLVDSWGTYQPEGGALIKVPDQVEANRPNSDFQAQYF